MVSRVVLSLDSYTDYTVLFHGVILSVFAWRASSLRFDRIAAGQALRRISTPFRIDFPTMRKVALYGNSLVVSSIGASLQGRAGLQVSSVDAALPDAASRLGALQPDVVIFDLAMAQPEFAIALWKAQPRLLLIGVDLTIGQALVLSSQPSRLLTMDDLLQVIEG